MSPKNPFLGGPRVNPVSLKPGMTVSELVDVFRASGAYQGGRLSEACGIYKRMIEEGAVVGLTLSGAMTPAGMGGALCRMINDGFVDWIVSTGANVFHDLHFALDLALFQGDFAVSDIELRQEGVDRIYDIFLDEKTILDTERFIFQTLKRFHNQPAKSTAELHNILGKAVLEKGADPEKSFVAAAAKADLPIYTSSPGDSVIGMDLTCLRLKNVHITIDPVLDVMETGAIVMNAERNGVIIVGGGSPKNFYLQTQPFLEYGCGIKKGGHDYDIQIGTDPPHWGGLSGATPSEAVSWGKINPEELEKNSVVVYSDATVAIPILFSYLLSEHDPVEKKRLYTRRDEFVEELKNNFNMPLYL